MRQKPSWFIMFIMSKINKKCKTLSNDIAKKYKCVLSSRNFYNVPNCTYLYGKVLKFLFKTSFMPANYYNSEKTETAVD